MRKKQILIVALGVLLLLGGLWIAREVKAAYGLRSFYCSIIDQNNEQVTSACTMTVYTAGGHTAATVYADDQKTAIGTTLTSVTTGDFQFWGSASSYDIVVSMDSSDAADKQLGVTPPNSRFILPSTGLSSIIRTVAVTIGHPGASTDYTFDADDNHTAQNEDLGVIIPPYARILDVTVICTEIVAPNSNCLATLGLTSGSNDFIAEADSDTADATIGAAAGGGSFVAVSSSAQHAWFKGDPDDSTWLLMTAGEWLVTVTYLDIGSLN